MAAEAEMLAAPVLPGAYSPSARSARFTPDRGKQTSKILASPVVHDGVVYVGNEASIIYAFAADAQGGAVWQQPIVLDLEDTMPTPDYQTYKNRTGVSSAAIAAAGGTHYLVFGCDDGYVYWIDLSDPAVPGPENRAQLTGCVESSVSVWAGETLFVGATKYDGDNFFRIPWDAEQGKFGAPEGPEGIGLDVHECRATAALRPGRTDPPAPDAAFVGVDTGNSFHKLRLSDLSEACDPFEVNEGNPLHFVGSAAIVGDLVFVGNDNGRLYVLRAEPDENEPDPEKAWKAGDAVLLDADDDQSGGYVCSSPGLTANVDGEDGLWLFVTTRDAGGALFAFKVVQE